jgi:hypothetical protein
MGEVVDLRVATTLDIPCERVLRRATEADLETVIVIGREKDGELYFASSVADGGDVLWLMEHAKKALLSI